LNVGTDLRGKLQVRQPITIINGGPGQPGNIERAIVEAVTSSTVVVDSLSNSYDTGSIFGLNPMPVCVSNWDPVGASSPYEAYFIINPDGTRSGALGQIFSALKFTSNTENQLDGCPITLYYSGDKLLHYLFPLYYKQTGDEHIFGRDRWMMVATQPTSWSWGDRVLVGSGVDPDDGWGTCGGIFDEPFDDGSYVYVVGPGVPVYTSW